MRYQHFSDSVHKIDAAADCHWISWRQLPRISGSLFMPGPVLGEMAWQRRCHDSRAFSIVGVTHTTATNKVMDAIGELITAPTQPWDALICTSKSVKAMVTQILEAHAEYLTSRFDVAKRIEPTIQLPVIPLGIDSARFAVQEKTRDSLRKQWRQKLGIQQDDFVALYLGRLNFHAKAHPMPMYKALEEAARRTGKTVYLLMAGWFENDAIKDEFVDSAKTFCPTVKTIFIDGRHAEVRQSIWFAADVFTSLVDNVQETFGLTPLEAMAAGLPVVASDWDGYRETVRNGTDGILIPTRTSPPGSFSQLAYDNATGAINYDRYIGYQSLFTQVDIKACADAFEALIKNQDLGRRMGQSAQMRVRQDFDWSVIIRSYQSLLKSLSDIRIKYQVTDPTVPTDRVMTLRQDPSDLFLEVPNKTPERWDYCLSQPLHDAERIWNDSTLFAQHTLDKGSNHSGGGCGNSFKSYCGGPADRWYDM